MNTSLIIPDIHLRHYKVQKIIDHEKADQVVFLGDHFDDFGDSAILNYGAAQWVKARMAAHPEDVFIWGNHDTHYAFPFRYNCCSGYTPDKEAAVKSVLGAKEWDRFVFHHWLGPYLCTHAGLATHYAKRVKNFKKWMAEKEEEAQLALRSSNAHWVFGAGKARYGCQPAGGLTWLDWRREFQAIRGLNQIVGHTIVNDVKRIVGEQSINYNLDTNNEYYGLYNHKTKKLEFKHSADEVPRWLFT